MNSKYLNKVFDGVRKVVEVTRRESHSYYLLENIYNKQTCEIDSSLMFLVAKGKRTVSNVISSRIKKSERTLVY